MRKMGIGLGVGINRSNYAQGIFNAYSARVVADGGVVESGSCVDAVSSLLQSASLLLIPSGYKGGKLYAEIPTNRNGDLTWTRGGDAFRTNESGVLQRVPWNLIPNSQVFSGWQKVTVGTTVTVTDNAITAPNDTMTAAKVVFSTFSTSAQIYQAIQSPSAGVFTTSIYAKVPSGTKQILFGFFDGTIKTQTRTLTTQWQRIEYSTTLVSFGSSRTCWIYGDDGTSNVEIHIWGGQHVEGTTAQTYLPTTDRLNFPRLSYMYGSCPSALLEPQRTNSIRNSTMVGASTSPSTLPTNWVRQNTSGLTESVVGLGTENGINYIDINLQGIAIGANDAYSFDQTISASIGQTWTNSWHFKLVTSNPNAVRLAVQEFNGGAFLNVVTQDITPTTTLARYSQTKTLVGTGVTNVRAMIYLNFVIGQTYNTTIRIAQPQMELGAYATTAILTTGSATATRVADSFSRSNIYTNGLITSSGGTWFFELRNNISYTRDSVMYIGVGDTSTLNNNGIFIMPGVTSLSVLRKRIAGTESVLYITTTTTTKLAVKWNGTSCDVFANGIKVVSASPFTTTNMEWFVGNATAVPMFIQQMALFPTPLSDTDCATITTL